jgi:hypothetical protein
MMEQVGQPENDCLVIERPGRWEDGSGHLRMFPFCSPPPLIRWEPEVVCQG